MSAPRTRPGGSPGKEPATHPSKPRYTKGPLPAYRYLPGRTPHPRRDPRGHSYGRPEPTLPALAPQRWLESEAYLYGIDLYNCGYFWECHEVFEGLWRAAGRASQPGRFLQALLWVAAANLKAQTGHAAAARRLARRAVERLEEAPRAYLGIDVADFRQRVARRFEDPEPAPGAVMLELDLRPREAGPPSRRTRNHSR